MLCFEYLSKWPNAERRGSDDQRKSSVFRWLDTWKSAYTIKKSRIVGEVRDVAEETITSWMERIQELTEGHLSENIWNMDESGCFFKVGLSPSKLKIFASMVAL